MGNLECCTTEAERQDEVGIAKTNGNGPAVEKRNSVIE